MKRQHDEKHLQFIRALPCVIYADNTTTEAAHVRYSCSRAAKRPVGMGEKPDDCWVLPLCGTHHREQHKGNERKFWIGLGLDPIFIALALYRVSGDVEAGEQIIRSHQREPLMAGELE